MKNESTSLVPAGTPEELAIQLNNSFLVFFNNAKEWAEKASTIKVESVHDTDQMDLARSARLEMKKIRVAVDNKRKELGEDALRTKQAIDKTAKKIKGMLEPIEAHLKEQEDYIKIQEQKRISELIASRSRELEPYDIDGMKIGLAAMTDAEFDSFVEKCRVEWETKQKEEIAKREEAKRLREKNERLEKELEAQREATRKANELAEKERLKNQVVAPKIDTIPQNASGKTNSEDIAKIQLLAKSVGEIRIPVCSGENAKKLVANVKTLLDKTVNYINSNSSKI